MTLKIAQGPDGGFHDMQADEFGRLRIALQPGTGGAALINSLDLRVNDNGELLVTTEVNE